jgi:hypothetical protein
MPNIAYYIKDERIKEKYKEIKKMKQREKSTVQNSRMGLLTQESKILTT